MCATVMVFFLGGLFVLLGSRGLNRVFLLMSSIGLGVLIVWRLCPTLECDFEREEEQMFRISQASSPLFVKLSKMKIT